MPIETDILIEPCGQTFIEGNFGKIAQNFNRKKERPKFRQVLDTFVILSMVWCSSISLMCKTWFKNFLSVKVLDNRLECRPRILKSKYNLDSEKTKEIWYNDVTAISVQNTSEKNFRLSFLLIKNDELLFRVDRQLGFYPHFCLFHNFNFCILKYFIVTKSLKAKFHISHARKYALSCSKQSFVRFRGVHDFRQRYIWWKTKSWNTWCDRSYKGSIYSYFCFQEWSFRWLWRSVLIFRSSKVLS